MKNLKIAAAALGLMVSGLTVSTAASAQDYGRDHSNYDRRDDRSDYHGDRRDYRDDRRDWHHDRRDWRGEHRGYYAHNNGYGYGHRRDCRVTWRHHHRVTVCYR